MNTATTNSIPNQTPVPWGVAFTLAWSSVRRRFLRSLITMLGVILAIAFLTYMQVTDAIQLALVAARDDTLNGLLQKAGVDIFSGGGTSPMMLLLLGLSLLTCLVGIVNSMMMAVTERIKEIGTLKCLGAEDAFIVKTYFLESSLQGILGTLLGAFVGLTVALVVMLVGYRHYLLIHLPLLAVLRCVLTALVLGSLIAVSASIIPAYWAARKQPVDAMRVEE